MNGLTPEQIASYHASGYLVLPSALTRIQVAELKVEILEFLDEIESERASDEAYRNISKYRRFAVGLHLRKARVREYVTSALFQEIGVALIGPEVDLFATSTITKSAGRSCSVDWHQDMVYDASRDFSRILCWTSITASFPENGGLFVLPGSHRAGLLPHEKSLWYERDFQTIGIEAKEAVPLTLKEGQLIVLHPLVVHGSTENKTPGDRIALASMYQKPRAYSEKETATRIANPGPHPGP